MKEGGQGIVEWKWGIKEWERKEAHGRWEMKEGHEKSWIKKAREGETQGKGSEKWIQRRKWKWNPMVSFIQYRELEGGLRKVKYKKILKVIHKGRGMRKSIFLWISLKSKLVFNSLQFSCSKMIHFLAMNAKKYFLCIYFLKHN